jgi:NADH-quinone oxidoreductase subunit M
VGILIGVAYTLRVLQQVFFADQPPTPGPVAATANGHAPLKPISIPERLGAILLIGVSLTIGLYPRLLMDWIVPSFNSPLFEFLRKGGGL